MLNGESTPPPAYLFIGPPASGKGTHCRAISMLPGFCHLSTGHAFRRLVERGDVDEETLTRIRETTARGELLPDELAELAARNYLREKATAGEYVPDNDVLLLDGIPRTESQAQSLQKKAKVLGVFEFVCDREVSLARAKQRSRKEGRKDDANLDIVRHRLDIYYQALPSLIGAFPSDIVTKIDTTEPPHHVLRNVLAAMK